jgi:hypothetical protein
MFHMTLKIETLLFRNTITYLLTCLFTYLLTHFVEQSPS